MGTADETISKMTALFFEYAEDFGLSDIDFPDGNHQERQCEFEEQFKSLLCEYKGHHLMPDQCGISAHDYCAVCGERREILDGGVLTDHSGAPIKIKKSNPKPLDE